MYELYICGQLADLTDDIEIAWTYQSIDTDEPSAEHGAFSKSVELPGTMRNHDIFGNFFVLSRSTANGDTQDGGVYFDPRKRNDFILWNNGDIIERGYVKLDAVNNTNGDITYSCTLFSDKGDFFMHLMYNDEGEEINLGDLKYNLETVSGDTLDESGTWLIWDKNYVWLTWDALQAMNADPDDRRVQNYIVAAPTYGGYYDDFDSSKVLVKQDALDPNSVAMQLYAQVHSGSTMNGYSPYSGWMLTEATRDLDETEVMDFRSNQQRPAIKMSLILDAISDPQNNGGYEVIWDDAIKNSKYYKNTFIILDKLDFDLDEQANDFLDVGAKMYTSTRQGSSWDSTDIVLKSDSSTTFDTTEYLSPHLSIALNGTNWDNDLMAGYNYGKIYTSYVCRYGRKGKDWVYGGVVVRFDVYSGSTLINSSPNYLYSTEVYNHNKYDYVGYNCPDWKGQIATQLGISADSIILRQTTLKYDMRTNKVIMDGEPITADLELPVGDNIHIKVSNAWAWASTNKSGRQGPAYQSFNSKNGYMSYFSLWGDLETVENAEENIASGIYDGGQNPFVQKTQVTKNILFGNTESPYKYLVGFTRMMGAKIRYDLAAKKIYIQERKNYYIPKGHVIDSLIDRSQEIGIQPTLSEYKWYEYGFETPETYAAQLYNRRNKTEYGKKKVDTGYYFNNESKNLFDEIPYTNGIPYKMSSIYYNVVSGCPSMFLSPTFKVTEFKTTTSGGKTEIENQEINIYGYSSTKSLSTQKDFSGDKICAFDKDNGSVDDLTNCLVFFDGYRTTGYAFQITDNIPLMSTLNDNPCYLYTSGATHGIASKDDTAPSEIAKFYNGLPVFSKYLRNPDGVYTDSLDFMKPNYTFIGDEDLYQDGICIYDRFWRGYIEDLYEKNGKAVTVRYFLQDKPDEAMRRFYYFDNTVWVISEITDYDESKYLPTQVKFVKVYDTKNYTDGDIEWDMWIEDLYEDIDRPRPMPPHVDPTPEPPTPEPSGETYEYQWTLTEDTDCFGYNQVYLYKLQQRISGSTDSWVDVEPPATSIDGTGTKPIVVKTYNSEDCGYVPPTPSGSTSGDTSGTTSGCTSGCTGGQVQLILTDGTEEWYCWADGKIPANAYRDRDDIRIVKIYSGITEIGDMAFVECHNLTEVEISSDLTYVGYGAFGNCNSLVTIIVYANPAPVLDPEDYIFYGVHSGGTLIYPCAADYTEWFEYLPNWIDPCYVEPRCNDTRGCTTEVITMDNRAEVAYGGAWPSHYHNLIHNDTTHTICGGIDKVRDAYCGHVYGLTTYDGLREISDNTYYEVFRGHSYPYSAATSFVLANTIEYIGDNCFYAIVVNRLSGDTIPSDICIPDSVKYIGNYCFSIISAITATTGYINTDGHTFYPNGNNSLVYTDTAFMGITGEEDTEVTDFVFPSFTRFAIDNTIYGSLSTKYPNLTALTINNGMVCVQNAIYTAISNNSGLTNLSTITIPDSVTYIDSNCFKNTQWFDVKPYNGMVYAGKVAYSYKSSGDTTSSVTLQEGTKGISNLCFAKYVIQPTANHPNVSVISNVKLTAITIPSSVEIIGADAFSGQSGLTKVVIDDVGAWCETRFINLGSNPLTKGNGRLYLGSNEISDLTIPSSVRHINDYAFCNCKSLSSVTISNGVKTIGDYAFSGCTNITAVTIPSTVKRIGQYSFAGCKNLSSLTINVVGTKGVESIDYRAFAGCSGLTIIDVPQSVKYIDEWAFVACSALTAVRLSENLEVLNSWAFDGCSNLSTIVCQGMTPPEITTRTEGDQNNYEGLKHVASIGTLYVPTGSDYSSLMAKLPSGWTISYF